MNEALLKRLTSRHHEYMAWGLYEGLTKEYPQINHATKLKFVSYPEVRIAETQPMTFPVYKMELKPRKGWCAMFWRLAMRVRDVPAWKLRGYYESYPFPPAELSPPVRTITLRKFGVTDNFSGTATITCGYDPQSDTLYIRE